MKRRVEAIQLRELTLDSKLEAPAITPCRFGTSLRYFFTTTDSTTANITLASLMNLIVVSKTTTTVSSIVEAVKINRLKIWIQGKVSVNDASTGATPVLAGNSIKISVRDTAVPGVGVEKEIIVATSGSKGRFWEYRPRGFMSEWINLDVLSASSTLFALTPSPGHVPWVEIDVGLQLCTAASPATAAALVLSTTVDTTTAGAVLYPFLDSMSDDTGEGSQVLQPFYGNTVTVNMPRPAPVDSTSTQLPALFAGPEVRRACISSSSSLPRLHRG